MISEPKWVELGRLMIGVSEIKGVTHRPEILQMWKDIKRGGIKDDETPWCAAFVGAMLERAGVTSSRFESAKSYEKWGQQVASPCVGSIAVFSRTGGGHVGFVVGEDESGQLLVLGGNQSDKVCIRAFPMSRVTALRYPIGFTPGSAPLSIASANVSGDEA